MFYTTAVSVRCRTLPGALPSFVVDRQAPNLINLTAAGIADAPGGTLIIAPTETRPMTIGGRHNTAFMTMAVSETQETRCSLEGISSGLAAQARLAVMRLDCKGGGNIGRQAQKDVVTVTSILIGLRGNIGQTCVKSALRRGMFGRLKSCTSKSHSELAHACIS